MSLRVWTVLAATTALLAGLTTTAQAATSYRFTHVDTGKCMSVSGGGSTANGARIVLYTCNGATEQVWYQENRDEDGYYSYRNRRTNKCLSVAGGGSTAAGAEIIQWTCNGAPEQRWGLNYSGGHFHLENRKSGLAITPLNGGTANNTRLVQQEYVSTASTQLWEPV